MKAFVGFAGFGGVDIALKDAGLEVVGVEIDSDIAQVNIDNGGNIIIDDIRAIDPVMFADYDLIHFSPPCPNFSQARSKKSKQDIYQRISDLARLQQILNAESEIDLQLSRKICEFIRVIKPRWFTLENVWGYRKSLSFMNIWYTLLECGYGVDWWNLNAADYGVPQTRRRMIVIGRRDGRKPARPFSTHSKNPDFFAKPFIGWHEAIEDLIPDLPETQPANWQLARLPEKISRSLMLSSMDSSFRDGNNPSLTIVSNEKSVPHRAFIIGQGSHSEPKSNDHPSDTITANTNQTGVKAFIIGDEYNNWGDRQVMNRNGDNPVWAISANEKLSGLKVWQGRWVAMTPRCLARFQDFPDWFKLPESRQLACRGIGNAVPVGLYRAVIKSLIQ